MDVDSPGVGQVQDSAEDERNERVVQVLNAVVASLKDMKVGFDLDFWFYRLPSLLVSLILYAPDFWNLTLDDKTHSRIWNRLKQCKDDVRGVLFQIASPAPPVSPLQWDPLSHLQHIAASQPTDSPHQAKVYYRDNLETQQVMSTSSALLALHFHATFAEDFRQYPAECALSLLTNAFQVWDAKARDAVDQSIVTNVYPHLVAFYHHLTGYLNKNTFKILPSLPLGGQPKSTSMYESR